MENESVCLNDPNEDWQVEEERGRAGEAREAHHIGTRQLKLRPEQHPTGTLSLNRKSGNVPRFQGWGALPSLSIHEDSYSTKPRDSAGERATYTVYKTQFYCITTSLDVLLSALIACADLADLAQDSMVERTTFPHFPVKDIWVLLIECLYLSGSSGCSNRWSLDWDSNSG